MSTSICCLKLNGLCCPIFESSKESEARRSVVRLETDPIPIWWHRRRIVSPAATNNAKANDANRGVNDHIHGRDDSGNWNGLHDFERKNDVNANKDDYESPFPKSWSINYSGHSAEGVARDVQQSLLLDDLKKEYCNDNEEESSTVTDDSSVFSTVSQEQRQKQMLQRDEHGNCRTHPYIKLAEKIVVSIKASKEVDKEEKHNKISRFPKFLSKPSSRKVVTERSNGGNALLQKEEWKTILESCPECEREHAKKSKIQYHSPAKSSNNSTSNYRNQSTDSQSNSCNDPPAMLYAPFPATLTIIESHPDVEESILPALCVRTDAVPIDQTMNLSCTGGNYTDSSKWSTPDGVLDFLIPCDENGKVIPPKKTTISNSSNSKQANANTKYNRNNNKSDNDVELPKYHIMERIIPLVSIDHVSRGGDAWDVLRQSTGENDFGCQCDIKIHGFSDRLLRMDVVSFNTNRNNQRFGVGEIRRGRVENAALRRTFVGVDFLRSSISSVMGGAHGKSFNNFDNNRNSQLQREAMENNRGIETYSPENVISLLNTLVLWDRERRETGVESWGHFLTSFMEEYLGLGAPKAGKESIPVAKTPTPKSKKYIKGGRGDSFDII